jgi:hypothetical protein
MHCLRYETSLFRPYFFALARHGDWSARLIFVNPYLAPENLYSFKHYKPILCLMCHIHMHINVPQFYTHRYAYYLYCI